MKAPLDLSKTSKSFQALNAHLTGSPIPAPQSALERAGVQKEGHGSGKAPAKRRRKQMNKTEKAFANLLDARMRSGEIVSWDYEGLTLRWGVNETFQATVDFVVVESLHHAKASDEFPHVRLVFVEVKGRHIFDAGKDRFRHARDNFPLFEFQMWARRNGVFERIR